MFWWNQLHRVQLFNTFIVRLNSDITILIPMETDLVAFSISHTVGWRTWFILLSPRNKLNYCLVPLWVSFVNLAACWEENDTHVEQWMHPGLPIFSTFRFPTEGMFTPVHRVGFFFTHTFGKVNYRKKSWFLCNLEGKNYPIVPYGAKENLICKSEKWLAKHLPQWSSQYTLTHIRVEKNYDRWTISKVQTPLWKAKTI